MTITPSTTRRKLTDYQWFGQRFPEFLANLKKDQNRCNRVLEWLEREPNKQRQRDRTRKFLGDAALHRICAFDAVRRTSGLANATPELVLSLAASFDAFRPTHEPYQSFVIARGSRRRVQEYGPSRRMHQRAIARVLRALHPPLEVQMLFRGGMPKARKAIEAAVHQGNTFGVEIDFVGFYPSVRPDALPNLLRPLPRSVVDAVVWDNACRSSSHQGLSAHEHDPASSSPVGLSMGSACSPIVGEAIIKSLLEVAQLRDVVTFADNLFVYGRSEEDVVAKVKTLRDAVGNQPFGELEIRIPKERGFALEWSFEFAKQDGSIRDGTVHWSPGAHKLAQYQASEAPRLTADQIARAEARVVHWRRAYSDWHDGDAFAAEYLAALAARRFYLNRNPLHLRRAIDAVIIAHWERSAIEPDFVGGLLHFVPTEGDILGDARPRLIRELERFVQTACQRDDVPVN